MKKCTILLLISICVLSAYHSSAQNKSAYISVTDMVSIMPETARVDSILQRYSTDSVAPEYDRVVTLYKDKLALFNDSLKTTEAIHKSLAQELSSLMYEIQNWPEIEKQAMDSKRNALFDPIYRKVYDAIKLVAKEKGYTHVVNKEAYLVAPDGDDLIVAVAAKLKVTIPQGIRRGTNR